MTRLVSIYRILYSAIVALMLEVPSAQTQQEIAQAATQTLRNRMHFDAVNKTWACKICIVCDTIATVTNPVQSIPVDEIRWLCENTGASRATLQEWFPNQLLAQYTSLHPALSNYAVSPSALFFEDGANNQSCTYICQLCHADLINRQSRKYKKRLAPPQRAIWNGYLIGNPPEVLTRLNKAERAIVSPNRIVSHALSLRADQHEGVYGWHALYENQVDSNVASVQQLVDAGLKGEIVCVLCGPFTTAQVELVRYHLTIRPAYVMAAFEWLKANNPFFADFVLPNIADIPLPYIYKDESFSEEAAGTQQIENQFNVTVIFPDAASANATNAGFKTQEEFRSFLCNHQNDRVDHAFYTRPSRNRKPEYEHDEIVRAFPLQFPFGIGGFPNELRLKEFRKSHKCRLSYDETLQLFLRHRRKEFHQPDFNLFINTLVMKKAMFNSARLQCNLRYADARPMGEKYGEMNAINFENSVNKARANMTTNPQSDVGDAFLKSVSAMCQNLPHSNEAAANIRSDYYSLLIRFALPALFVTISPDDQRSVWIRVYLLKECQQFWDREPTVADVSDADLLCAYKQRQADRIDYPGLCAEDFMAIIECFIRDVLRWDVDKCEPFGEGLFGFLEAYAMACEEQGRKSLHAHFLLWIRHWNDLLHRVMEGRGTEHERRMDLQRMCNYVRHCSSAQMFQDCGPNKALSEVIPFHHENCRSERTSAPSRFAVDPVPSKQLVEMRNNRKCIEHRGHIATCRNCNSLCFINQVLETSLNAMEQSPPGTFVYPDAPKRRLESLVFEMQRDFDWVDGPPRKKARRLFATNALSNQHRVGHSPRCFKKGPTCYARLPAEPLERRTVNFANASSTWASWDGERKEKRIFEVDLERKIEDVYTNVHNPILMMLFLCNNNIAAAMTGASVLYVTSYSHKKTQDDDRIAYDDLASKLLKILTNQEADASTIDGLLPNQVGFRRLLLALYLHTNALVVAAPMAHYLAIHKSRYRFSHVIEYLPIATLSKLMRNETVSMYLTTVAPNKRVPFCRALHYLHRPRELENMSPYEFWANAEVLKFTDAKRRGLQEVYHFVDDHPKNATMCVTLRQIPCVPNLDWTFIGDTKELQERLSIPPVRNAWNTVAEKDEQHARRFLLAFHSYRVEDDLQYDGSYKRRLIWGFRQGLFDQFIPIANNIQNIRNSLDAGRMKDDLPSEEVDVDQDEAVGSAQNENAEVMNLVANFFASNQTQAEMHEEPTDFSFHPPNFQNTSCASGDLWESPQSVIGTPEERPRPRRHMIWRHRYKASMYGMNSLVQSHFLMDTESSDGMPDVRPTGTVESIIAYGYSKKLDLDQQTAFEILTATFVLTFVDDLLANQDLDDASPESNRLQQLQADLRKLAQVDERNGQPLRLFLTGPAGAGKSTILESLMDYARAYCRSLGHMFDDGTIRLTALTGSAATEIRGATLHSTVKLGPRSRITDDDIEEWLNTRLLVIDEISFAGYDTVMAKLSPRLQSLTQCNDFLYGKVAIVFIGDFFQLEPTQGKAIYKVDNSLYWELTLNCMVELKGDWRFKDCSQMREAMRMYRAQGLTKELRDLFNSRMIGNVVDGKTIEMPDIRKTQVATFANATRHAANDTVFNEHLARYHSKDPNDAIPDFTVIIKGYVEWAHNKQPLSFGERHKFFAETTEQDVHLPGSPSRRCAPMLKLFYKTLVMGTDNEDVSNGVANGTTASFEYLVLKEGKQAHKIKFNGYWVYAVNAEDVDYMKLRWTADSTFEGTFCIAPSLRTYVVHYKINEFGRTHKVEPKMRIGQFLITVNHATTGHKLQGKSLEEIIIREWALGRRHRNWIYVVLSRVKRLNGLFLMEPIPEDDETAPPPEMLAMLDRLRTRLLVRADHPDIVPIRASLEQYRVA